MKLLFKALIGFASAVLIMALSNLFIQLFDIDKNESNFFIGWISCMGYYVSIKLFEMRYEQH